MTDEERLDLLLQVVVLMHNALDWSDKRYANVHGERIKERLKPLVDEWQRRIEPKDVFDDLEQEK